MTQRPASKIVLPQFTLTEVCAPDDEGASLRQLASTGSTEPLQYAHRPALRPVAYSQTGATYSYNLMPVVLDGTGAPWPEANLYILARLDSVLAPNMTTYH